MAIELTNDDNISALQFDLSFPEGLTYVENSIEKNKNRITRTSHSIRTNTFEDGTLRFGVFTNASDMDKSAINGNSGTIFTIKLLADESYEGGHINITNVIGSDGTVKEPVEIIMPDSKVTAGVEVGKISVEETDMELKVYEPAVVNVNFDNIIAVNALQAKITLPKGVELAEDEDGECITYTERLTDNHVAMINLIPESTNEYMLVISAITLDDFVGNEGTLFGLNIVANEEFEGGEITFTKLIASNKKGVRLDIDDTLTVNCTTVATGINSVVKVGTAKDIYTLGGAKVKTAQKGINIVRTSDGVVKKVMTK